MAASLYSADLTVAQVLRRAPRGVPAVFMARRTLCVGCPLARFCTLEDVAGTYGIPLAELLGDLQRAAHTHPTSSGVQDD